jgi:tryptophan synthase alpha chain
MINRIDKLFSEKKKNILSIYFTAGFPRLDDTGKILQALEKYGVDMVEIGMPYSDPLADGPVIQQSSAKALQNGITINKVFAQLKAEVSRVKIPLILMGYLNPVLQYGIERFCRDAQQVGIDGIILPDLPLTEFKSTYKYYFEKYKLHFIFLVTPETTPERVKKMDAAGSGFIYAVSSSSITGMNKDIGAQEKYFKRLQKMKLRNPVMVGFGIKDRKTFSDACKYASGAIIGTAYIKTIGNSVSIDPDTHQFLETIR